MAHHAEGTHGRQPARRSRVPCLRDRHAAGAGALPLPGFALKVAPPPLGRSQAVRQRILIPPYGGSNPPAPAIQLRAARYAGFSSKAISEGESVGAVVALAIDII